MQLYEELKKNGILVEYEYPIGRSSVDLAIPEKRLVIEVDGLQHAWVYGKIPEADVEHVPEQQHGGYQEAPE